MLDYKAIGRRIRRLRLSKKWSQEDLAEKVNISVSFMGHIERGSRKMSAETLFATAAALNCSVDQLAGRSHDVATRDFAVQLLEEAIALAHSGVDAQDDK